MKNNLPPAAKDFRNSIKGIAAVYRPFRWHVALCVLIVLMLVGLLGSKMFYRTQRRLTDEIRKQDSKSLEHVQESLQNRAMALSLSGSVRVNARFSSILDRLRATYGMMTAFLQLVGQVQRPLAELSRHVPAFIQAMSSEERLSELEALPELALADGPVLDEAPALDSATEAVLLERLASEYRGRKTILMITHRECALYYADEILRLDWYGI